MNVKSWKCGINNKIISEEKKFLYKYKKINLNGISCEKCNDGYIFKIFFVLMVFIALKKMVKEIAENAKMIINISHVLIPFFVV